MQKWISTGVILATLVAAGCSDVKAPSAESSSRPSGPDILPEEGLRTRRENSVPAIHASLELRSDARSELSRSMTMPSESGESLAETETGSQNETPRSPGEGSPDVADAPVLLEIGDQAPVISVARWVRGEPAAGLSPGGVYVIQFWETTCLPCLDSIRHMASLQAEYRDKVTLVGITPEEEIAVTTFLETDAGTDHLKWSAIVNFALGIDDRGQTRAAYMDAAEQDGLPCAFIIGRTGRIEWMGHSQDMETPLTEIVEGTWDSAKARKHAAECRSAKKARLNSGPDIKAAVDAGEYGLAVELMDELLQRFPDDRELAMFRMQCLIRGGMPAEANATAAKMISADDDDAVQLDKLAWILATASDSPDIDLDLALVAVRRAAELTQEQDASVLETMARVRFRMGSVEDAVTLQKRALDLVHDSPRREPLKTTLAEYETAFDAGREQAKDATLIRP